MSQHLMVSQIHVEFFLVRNLSVETCNIFLKLEHSTWAYALSGMLLEPLCISIALFENMNFHPLFSCSILLKAILFMFVMIWIVNKPSFRYSWFSFSIFDKVPPPPPPPLQVLFLKISKISQVSGNYFFESNFSKFFWYPKCKKSKSR
jgi:hypothetical protein